MVLTRSRKLLVVLITLVAFSAALALLFSYDNNSAPEASGIVLVPAYFYPASMHFQRLISVKPEKTIIVVLNVFNGPSSEFNDDYRRAVEELLSRGMIPVGYVYTKYTRRSISEVEGDIDKWFEFYSGIKGVFIDEVSGDTGYYAELYNYVKSKYDGIVVLNPGTNFPPELAQYCDYIVLFEGRPQELRGFQVDSSLQPYLGKTILLVYGVSTEEFCMVYSAITRLGVRSLYVTHDNLPNPWDTLSNYFKALAEDAVECRPTVSR